MVLMLLDVLATVLMLAVMEQLRPYLPGRVVFVGEGLPHPVVYVMVAVLWHAVFGFTGVYESRIIPSFHLQFHRMTAAYVLTVLIFTGFLFFTFRELSRMLVIYFAAANYLVLLMIRYAMTVVIQVRGKRGGAGPVVIVGCTENGRYMARTLMENHGASFKVVGFVDDHCPIVDPLQAPILGTLADLPRIIEEQAIEMVVIALPENRTAEAESLIVKLDSLPVKVYMVPDMGKLAYAGAEMETVGALLVIGLRESVIKRHRRVAKRVLDLVVSSVMLMLLWPVMLAIWIAVKLDSKGPGLFVARRVGENGKQFDMYKFRTMVAGAEALQDRVAEKDEKGRAVFKVKIDPRVTGLGRWLRKTSLDELPQLVNVFKGEMSLVGPRPEQPFIAEKYDHWQRERLSVPPGITGWWQISGRSDLPMHLNTQYDIHYVRNYSTLLDIKILLRTIGVVLKGRGAY